MVRKRGPGNNITEAEANAPWVSLSIPFPWQFGSHCTQEPSLEVEETLFLLPQRQRWLLMLIGCCYYQRTISTRKTTTLRHALSPSLLLFTISCLAKVGQQLVMPKPFIESKVFWSLVSREHLAKLWKDMKSNKQRDSRQKNGTKVRCLSSAYCYCSLVIAVHWGWHQVKFKSHLLHHTNSQKQQNTTTTRINCCCCVPGLAPHQHTHDSFPNKQTTVHWWQDLANWVANYIYRTAGGERRRQIEERKQRRWEWEQTRRSKKANCTSHGCCPSLTNAAQTNYLLGKSIHNPQSTTCGWIRYVSERKRSTRPKLNRQSKRPLTK